MVLIFLLTININNIKNLLLIFLLTNTLCFALKYIVLINLYGGDSTKYGGGDSAKKYPVTGQGMCEQGKSN